MHLLKLKSKITRANLYCNNLAFSQ